MKVKLPLAVLVLVNAGLLTTLGWRLLEGSERDRLLQTEGGPSDVTFDAVDVPAAASIDSIQARAIFHQPRNFYVAPPPAVAEPPPPDYRLAGFMTVAGKQSATLIHSQSGARVRVGSGDQVEGWIVAAIQPGKVILQSGSRMAEIISGSRSRGGGVTVTGAQAANVGAPANRGGVRVIGNASPGAPRSQSSSTDSLNQGPRVYRPPVPQL
jgi:hypothetical protein